MIDATDLNDVFDMLGHSSQRHVWLKPPITSEIAGEEIAANHTIGRSDYAKLFVIEVSSALAQRMTSAVCGHKWFGTDCGNIQEAGAVEMRKINHDAKLITRGNKPLACVGKSWADVVRTWPAKPNTRSKHVGT